MQKPLLIPSSDADPSSPVFLLDYRTRPRPSRRWDSTIVLAACSCAGLLCTLLAAGLSTENNTVPFSILLPWGTSLLPLIRYTGSSGFTVLVALLSVALWLCQFPFYGLLLLRAGRRTTELTGRLLLAHTAATLFSLAFDYLTLHLH